ncbi:UDP-N-acetylglucosamine--undecaprenyl-phosphate N-acetylglucosaminephosphotransferase [Pseudomonas graminis]
MQDIVILFMGALALLFIARKVACRIGLVDRPNGRKRHNGSIPLVGGISVYLSLWLIFLLQITSFPQFLVYMCCVTLLLLVGIADDRFDLPVLPRFGVQAAVAAVMMWEGVYLSSLGNIWFGSVLMLGSFGYLVTLLAVIAAINAFNMMDGLDGVLGAVSSVTIGSLAIIFWLGGRHDIALWCICLIVICLPYMLLNIGFPWGKKFKVFMGDSGSMLIGFTVIWLLIIASQGPGAVMKPITGLWLIAVPLVDMLRVMTARMKRGANPFKPDREHLHHVLLRSGLNAYMIPMATALLSMLFSVTGLLIDKMNLTSMVSLIAFIMSSFIYISLIGLFSKNYQELKTEKGLQLPDAQNSTYTVKSNVEWRAKSITGRDESPW